MMRLEQFYKTSTIKMSIKFNYQNSLKRGKQIVKCVNGLNTKT